MKRITIFVAAAAAALILPVVGSTFGAPLRETRTAAGDQPIPNLPGKRLVSFLV